MRFFSKEKRNAIFHGHLLLFRSRPSHRLVVQAPPSGFKGGIWLRFRTFSVKFAQKRAFTMNVMRCLHRMFIFLCERHRHRQKTIWYSWLKADHPRTLPMEAEINGRK
jgi:hypothetical protein